MFGFQKLPWAVSVGALEVYQLAVEARLVHLVPADPDAESSQFLRMEIPYSRRTKSRGRCVRGKEPLTRLKHVKEQGEGPIGAQSQWDEFGTASIIVLTRGIHPQPLHIVLYSIPAP